MRPAERGSGEPTGERAPQVLYIIQCTNLGGMERTSSEQARLLRERHGVRYRAISPRPPGPGRYLFDAVDPGMEFASYRGRFNWRGHRAFAARVKALARDADAVYVAGTCVSSLRAARATGKPVILANHYHHGGGWLARLRWWLFYRLFCRGLRGAIFVSPFTRDEALRLAPWLAERASFFRQSVPVVVPPCPQRHADERRQARARLGLPPDGFIVGNAGWLIPSKRFDVFLEVAALVRQSVPGAVFAICGDGREGTALRTQAAALGLTGCVRFFGWVSDLGDHYRAWDVNLFSSDFDAIARTPLEAMAHGVNLVASMGHGGLHEFFAKGDRGVCLPDHDVPALARAVIALNADPARAARQRGEAEAHLRATYTPEAATEPIRALLFAEPVNQSAPRVDRWRDSSMRLRTA